MIFFSALAVPGRAAAQSSADPVPVVSPASTATLRPGDLIRLRIWREEDLSGEFPVDRRGEVVLPKLGPVSVVGLGADSLHRLLVNSYAEYLRNPSVEVTLLRRISISGAVQKPGVYPVDLTMTISDALALAGGASSDGKTDEAILVRGGERLSIDLAENIRIGETPLESGDQLYVPQRSWISRNGWVLGAAITTVTSVALALMR